MQKVHNFVVDYSIIFVAVTFKQYFDIHRDAEVEFVHAVTAGGSVKFLPAV